MTANDSIPEAENAFERTAYRLEAELSKSMLRMTLLTFASMGILAFFLIHAFGWTAFAIMQSIGAMLFVLLVMRFALQTVRKTLISKADDEIVKSGGNVEAFHRYVAADVLRFALAAHAIARMQRGFSRVPQKREEEWEKNDHPI